jgi:hypothetical protein
MAGSIEILAHLGRLTPAAAESIGAVLLLLGFMVYWALWT